MLQISVDRFRQERWRTAAESAQCSLDAWIAATLDEAADSLLAGA